MGRLTPIALILAGLAPALPVFAESHAGLVSNWIGADIRSASQEPYASFLKNNPFICCFGCPTIEQMDQMMAEAMVDRDLIWSGISTYGTPFGFPLDGKVVEASLVYNSTNSSGEFPTLAELTDD